MEAQTVKQNIPQQPIETPKIKTGSSTNWLLISSIALFIIVTVLLIGTLGFLLGTNKISPKIATQTATVVTAVPTVTPTPTTDPTINWKTYNNIADGYKMIGNAVPVKLAQVIAQKIKHDLSHNSFVK